MSVREMQSGGIFPLGERTTEQFRQYYTGTCFEKILAGGTSVTGVTAAHVTYEAGCRNDWHSHPGGQLLLALSGRGIHQEDGKPAVFVNPGDVIEIGPNVKHWHGASKDSCYSYIAVKEISTAGMPRWYGPVSDTDYGACT